MKPQTFQNASNDFRLLNAHALNKTHARANAATKRRGSMNKTEAEYALLLEADKRKRKAKFGCAFTMRYEFEGITLRWADMRYTPDFVVIMQIVTHTKTTIDEIKLIEVKGPHIWDRDIVRFKGARAYWPQFQFEMWQKTGAGWTQKM